MLVGVCRRERLKPVMKHQSYGAEIFGVTRVRIARQWHHGRNALVKHRRGG